MRYWQIDVSLRHAAWAKRIRLPRAFARKIAAAVGAELPDAPRVAEVAVILAGDGLVRRLNRTYRHSDRSTNVLSFPPPSLPQGGEAVLGDIVLAYQTVSREAAEQGKAFAAHAAHLIVHGLLHLLGYDHQRTAAAELMEALEIRILARLGVPDPYARSSPRRQACR
jgi:probable rRNA maturation factor